MRDMGGKAVCDASGCGVNLRNLGQQPLGAVPFGHSETDTDLLLPCCSCLQPPH